MPTGVKVTSCQNPGAGSPSANMVSMIPDVKVTSCQYPGAGSPSANMVSKSPGFSLLVRVSRGASFLVPLGVYDT